MSDESRSDESLRPGGIPSQERVGKPKLSAKINAAARNAASERSREARTQERERLLASVTSLAGLAVAAAATLGIPGFAAIGALGVAVAVFLSSRVASRFFEEAATEVILRWIRAEERSVTSEPDALEAHAGLARLGERLATDRAALQELSGRNRKADAHG
jgi:hypothetical protein